MLVLGDDHVFLFRCLEQPNFGLISTVLSLPLLISSSASYLLTSEFFSSRSSLKTVDCLKVPLVSIEGLVVMMG